MNRKRIQRVETHVDFMNGFMKGNAAADLQLCCLPPAESRTSCRFRLPIYKTSTGHDTIISVFKKAISLVKNTNIPAELRQQS